MSVQRRDERGGVVPLAVGEMRGLVQISEAALHAIEGQLPTYRGVDGDHEGIALVAGRMVSGTTILTTAIFPRADHRKAYVRTSDQAFADASKAARAFGLGILAQVHSHPGESAIHSIGDDSMVRPRFDGLLSVVVPHYGRYGMRPLETLGVHEFIGGQWQLATPESVRERFTVVPGSIDLR